MPAQRSRQLVAQTHPRRSTDSTQEKPMSEIITVVDQLSVLTLLTFILTSMLAGACACRSWRSSSKGVT